MSRPARIFISVAEHSADMHAARLVRTAVERGCDWSFAGLTGPRLRAAGAETVYDFTAHAAMLSGILSVIGKAWRALAAAEASWREQRPDLVVVCDSSALHLKMAKRAKKHGLPVLYYIAPQVWASRPWRVKQIRKYVDRVACILPFEAPHLKERGVNAEFVGHPLFETLADEQPSEQRVAEWRSGGEPIVALLPGSRRQVIRTMLPMQLDVIRRLRSAGRRVRAFVSCVDDSRQTQVDELLRQTGVEAQVVTADNASLLTAADLVLAASGTATLHVAHYRKPTIVMYHAGDALYWPYRLAGRLLINLPHLSLVNILARARVMPEFMPFIRDLGPIAAVAGQLLDDVDWRELMVRQMDDVVRPLEESRPSQRVCDIMAEMVGDAAAASTSRESA